MNVVCIILSLLGGWNRVWIGEYNVQDGIRGVVMGDARNDGVMRIYGGSDEGYIYEYTYTGEGWEKEQIAQVQGTGVHSLAIGAARNDGVNRIYIPVSHKDKFNSVYELSWDDALNDRWKLDTVGPMVNTNISLCLGYGRNDNTLRVYTGTSHTLNPEGERGECYELTYDSHIDPDSATWIYNEVGGYATVTNDFQHDVFIGYGRDDDTLRLYSACTDGNVWEFTFRESVWEEEIIGDVNTALGVLVADGRNDGHNRLYVSTGRPANTPGAIYEFTWNGGLWLKEKIWQIPDTFHFLGLGAGTGRNDDIIRLYTGSSEGADTLRLGGILFELTWENGRWEVVQCGQVALRHFIHDIKIGPGRNDNFMRVYAGAGDGRLYEFTWVPEPRIRVYPDSSTTINPGNSSIYRLWVVNEGTNPDVIDMTSHGTLPGWTVELLDVTADSLVDSDGDGVPDVGGVDVIDSVPIRVRITSPTDSAGLTDSTWVVGVSSHSSEIRDSALLTTEIIGLTVEPDHVDSTLAGQTIDYPLNVSNLSHSNQVVKLSVEGTLPDWTGQLLDEWGEQLTDNDGDGLPEVGPLETDESVDIIFRLATPADGLAGTIDTSVVRGQSVLGTVAGDTASIITTLKTIPRVSIVADSADSTPAGVAIRYRALITNLGNRDDAVNLVVGSTTDWPGALYASDGTTPLTDSDGDGELDAGIIPARTGTREIIFELTPPVDARHNTVDTAFVTAFSSFSSQARDSIRLLTRVLNPLAGVSIEPDTSVIALAGEDNAYPLRVTSSGDYPDSYELTSTSDQGWESWLTDTEGNNISATGTLDPGDTVVVELHVTPPRELGSLVGDPVLEEAQETRLVWAVSTADEEVRDSALLLIQALPALDIHNYPSPFSTSTTFIYSVPAEGKVSLAVFNRAGEHIVTIIDDQSRAPGIYTQTWDGRGKAGQQLAPGVYLYTLNLKPLEDKTLKVIKTTILEP